MARNRELEQRGKQYRLNHQGFLPDRVRRSGRKEKRKALEALGDGCGWLSRLAMSGCNLKFFTISLKTLGFEHLEHESNLYDHSAVNKIKQAILEVIPSSFWARLEVGNKVRRLHVHVIAHQAPTVAHNAQAVEALERIAVYICKCPVPGDDLSAGIFLEAKRKAYLEGRKRLPKTSFSRGIPNS